MITFKINGTENLILSKTTYRQLMGLQSLGFKGNISMLGYYFLYSSE